MFDIGFWELLVIAVVLLLVLGPERLPEVAKQAAFFVRKARQGMFRIRSEMRNELGGDPFEGLKEAKREVSNFKNDMKQLGRDLADSHETKIENPDGSEDVIGPEGEMLPIASATASVKQVTSEKDASKKITKKKANKKKVAANKTANKKTKKKVSKKTTKKAAKKVSKKATKKAVSKKTEQQP